MADAADVSWEPVRGGKVVGVMIDGSLRCLRCLRPLSGRAGKKYCSAVCRALAS